MLLSLFKNMESVLSQTILMYLEMDMYLLAIALRETILMREPKVYLTLMFLLETLMLLNLPLPNNP